MKKYILIILLLMCSTAFGNAHNITRVTDADMRTAVLRAGLVLDDFGGGGIMSSGDQYYVDSVNGASNRSGKSWALAVDTIDTAINLAAAAIAAGTEKGNPIIYVRESHNEGSAAAGVILDADVEGITIYGIGTGNVMPTIDFDHTSATCDVGADGITFFNIRFRASTDAVTNGIDIETGSDYTRFVKCDFVIEGSTDEFATALYVGTSTGTKIFDCLFDAGTASAVNAIEFDAATRLQIERNKIFGAYSEACIANNITLAEEIFIIDNVLWNGETDALNTVEAWEFLAGTVGISKENIVALNVANTNLAFVGDGIYNFNNYYTESSGGAKTALSIDLVGATSSNVDANMSITDGSGG